MDADQSFGVENSPPGGRRSPGAWWRVCGHTFVWEGWRSMGRQVSRQQFVGEGVGDGGGAAGHAELGEDVLDVVLGSAPADEQGLADVGVGGAVGEQLQYLKLAGAQ